MYPRVRSLIAAGACAFVLVALPAACGGGSSSSGHGTQVVHGQSFRYAAPGEWHVSRTQDRVAAAPKPLAPELVQVSADPLRREYTPALYTLVVTKELDPAAQRIAADQRGKVLSARNVMVAGIRARQYELQYSRAGKKLGELITYVLRGRTGYELLCQWDASSSQPDYCGKLTRSFRPT